MRRPVVINIRGTSGSGKSSLVREAMKGYRRVRPVHEPDRKRPIYYVLTDHPARPDLTVLGHYETACGGCDTITEQDRIFELARDAVRRGQDVVFEGLLVSAEFRRTAQLGADLKGVADFYVLHLDVPLAECVAGVQSRRTARGDERPLNPKNTESKHKGTRQTCSRLAAAGVHVEASSREGGLRLVNMWLDQL